MSGRFQVALVSARAISPSVRSLVFRRTDGAPMEFRPGQWVNLFGPSGDPEDKRSYSIASAPDGTPAFEIVVTRVEGGRFSNLLHGLDEGDELACVGPQGLFTREADDARPAVFVGTGTGVAPLRSMIEAGVTAGTRCERSLLFGVRTEADVFFGDDMQRWSERAGVRSIVTLSRPSDDWTGARGYVQTHLEQAIDRAGPRAEVQVYVCGLTRMVEEVKALARGPLGLPRRSVHVERYD